MVTYEHGFKYRPIPIYIGNIVWGSEVSDMILADIGTDIEDIDNQYW